MELLFNELSLTPLCADKYQANNRMILFAETVNIVNQKGFEGVRSHFYTNQISLAEGYSVHNWLTDREASKDHKDYLFGKFRYPFIKEDDNEIEGQYVDADYYFESKEDNIKKRTCLGLASAFLYETLSISLRTLSVWDKHRLPIIIEKDGQISTSDVFNISSVASFNIQEIIDFTENIRDLTLIETTIQVGNKDVNISGTHHGNAERNAFWKRIKYNPYVISMYSTGGYGTERFIRNIYKNGTIEIVLERKYSVLVQTTGRNYRETKAIAEILEEEYS